MNNLVRRVRMGHFADCDQVVFHRMPGARGNALSQLEEELSRIVEEELAKWFAALRPDNAHELKGPRS